MRWPYLVYNLLVFSLFVCGLGSVVRSNFAQIINENFTVNTDCYSQLHKYSICTFILHITEEY